MGTIRLLVAAVTITALTASPAGATVFFSDDFETGAKSTEQNGFRYGSTTGPIEVVSDTANSGSFSLRFKFAAKPPGGDNWVEQRLAFGSNISDTYLRWYQYFPNGTEDFCPGGACNKWFHRDDIGPDNNKWMRIWGDDYSADTKHGMAFRPTNDGTGASSMRIQRVPDDCSSMPGGTTAAILGDSLKGKWFCVEVQHRINTGSADGRQRFWIDGELKYDTGNMDSHVTCNPKYFNAMYLMGWANSGFDVDSYTYIDDFVIADSYIGTIDNPPDPDPDPVPDPVPDPEASGGNHPASGQDDLDTSGAATEPAADTVKYPNEFTLLENLVDGTDAEIKIHWGVAADRNADRAVKLFNIHGSLVETVTEGFEGTSTATVRHSIASLDNGIYFAVPFAGGLQVCAGASFIVVR